MSEENLLDQGSKDLLQESATKEELKTQVTSIVEEEERTGQKVEVPSAEELVARASSSLIINKQHLNNIVNARNGSKFKLNRRAMNRILMAILDLPTDGLPVNLRSEDEKLAFALGQKMISDRFIIMQHHISQEMKKRVEQQQSQSEEKSEDTNNPEGGE